LLLAMVDIKPRTLHMIGKHSITKLYPQPFYFFYFVFHGYLNL
jgi:hypothetical protein